MSVTFTEPLVWRERGDPGLRALAALLGEDADAAQTLAAELERLRACFSKTDFAAPWGMACFPLEGFLVLARMRHAADGAWAYALRAADLRPYAGCGVELRPEDIVPGQGGSRRVQSQAQGAFAQWAGDGVFLEALRDAAFLTGLLPGGVMRCKIRENRQPLVQAVLADLLANAAAPQFLRYASFAAGSGAPPDGGYALLLSPGFSGEAERDGAFADFTASPPGLELRFPEMNFAMRTAKALLAPLGLSVLLSMWNAAARTVADALGERRAAGAQDLITWQMLRKNFSGGSYPITREEHAALQGKVKAFHEAVL